MVALLSTSSRVRLEKVRVTEFSHSGGHYREGTAEGCIALCYAVCMAQLVTRINDRLACDVDALISDGVAANRSEAVRIGLEQLVVQHRRRQTGAKIVEGYRHLPQSEEELTGLGEATKALIEEEPW